MKRVDFGILFVILFFLFAPFVSAISASPSSADFVYIPSEGLDEKVTFTFRASSSKTDSIAIAIVDYETPFGLPEGTVKFNVSQMEDYVKLSDESIDPTKENSVTVRIKIPPNAPIYGPHCFGISAREVPRASEGFFTVTTAVLLKVGIDAPYPDQYLDITKFSIDNVNEGESSKMYWQIKGRSTQETFFDANLEIFSKDGKSMFRRDLGTGSLDRLEVYPFDGYYESLPTNTFVPDVYEGVLTVKFANNVKKSSAKFNVGYESVILDNYSPSTLVYGEINEISLNVRSLWNGQFSNVNGIIEITGENITPIKATTPSGTLNPFGTLELKQFVDVRSLPEGNYSGKITINFEDLSISFPAQFEVAKRVVIVPEEKKEINVYLIAGIAVGVIVFALLIYLSFFRGRKEKRKN